MKEIDNVDDGLDFSGELVFDADESDPVELEEVPDPDFDITEEALAHLDAEPSPEDMQGVEWRADE